MTCEAICPGCAAALRALACPPLRLWRGGVWLAAYDYADPVRLMIHRGKYRADRRALGALALSAVERLRSVAASDPAALIPLPLGARRQGQRGYNQAEVIAGALGERLSIPLGDGLKRVRETRPQAGQDEAGRLRNVAGAFSWAGEPLSGARLWLVDDVLTTGATATAAGDALLRAGAHRVDVVTIAAVL